MDSSAEISTPVVGSSKSRTLGIPARDQAMRTRCSWPPDKVPSLSLRMSAGEAKPT